MVNAILKKSVARNQKLIILTIVRKGALLN